LNGCETRELAVHTVYLSIGSNINPKFNIPRAILFLRQLDNHPFFSTPYETRPVGGEGPNFINLSVKLVTHLDTHHLKKRVIGDIEARLGRVRCADKNAPRTIDLDIIVFDEQITDAEIWKRVYLAVPLAELWPTLIHPVTGENLIDVARQLSLKNPIIPRFDLIADINRLMGETDSDVKPANLK